MKISEQNDCKIHFQMDNLMDRRGLEVIFGKNFKIKSKVVVCSSPSQRPRVDLNKRFLRRPNTTTA